VVEQDQDGGDLPDLTGCDEQSENQRGYHRDQPNSKPHDVFDVLVQLIFRQNAAKQRAKKYAAKRQHEYDARRGQSAHD